MGSDELAALLENMPVLCPFGNEQWLNTDYYQWAPNLKQKMSIVHFASADMPQSHDNILLINELQKRYPTLNAVLVHRPRYSYPQGRSAIERRYGQMGIILPIYPDTAGAYATCTGVSASGTTLFVAPGGKIMETYTGPLLPATTDAAVRRVHMLLNEVQPMSREPFYPRVSILRRKQPLLVEPFGLSANEAEATLYATDRMSHRVLGIALSGDLINLAGRGVPGFKDGRTDEAEFNRPTGVAWDPQRRVLYVADEGNLRIRAIDFEKKEVTTLLGNGLRPQPTDLKVLGSKGAIGTIGILAMRGDELYLGNAHTGEWWRCDVRTQVAERIAIGPGAEPQGLAFDSQGNAFVTDGATNEIFLAGTSKPAPIFGKSPATHGFADGKKDQVRFRFPTALLWHNGSLYVADTYNHSIRQVDPFRKTCTTLGGNGSAGYSNGMGREAVLHTPRGMAVARGTLYLADSGNGLLRTMDLKTGKTGTLRLQNFEALALGAVQPIFDVRECPELTIGEGLNTIEYTINLGPEYEIDPEGFSSVAISAREEETDITMDMMRTGKFTVEVIGSSNNPRSSYALDFTLFLRNREKPELQYTRSVTFAQNYQLQYGAGREHHMEIEFDPDSE